MERSSRILLLLGPQRQNGWQVALSLGHRMSKTLPVELYSDGVPFRPADSRFYSHRCSHWACPPLRPVALIDAQGSQGVRQLDQWAAPLKEHGYELYLLVYPFSPPADTPRQTVRLIRQAQQRTGLQAKGLIHCPLPGHALCQSLDFIQTCSHQLQTPVVLHAAPSSLLHQFSKEDRLTLSCLRLEEESVLG